MTADESRGGSAEQGQFATTHWSLVLAAGDRQRPGTNEALARLCDLYWYPIYAYIRRRVSDVNEAQDLTQAFFVRLLEQPLLEAANPARGKFRAFLLTACKSFLINEWHKARAIKRGGGQHPLSFDFQSSESRLGLIAVDQLTAEQLYEQQWAITLLERVLEQLRAEYADKQRLKHFDVLKPYLTGAGERIGYAQAGRSLGISETTAKVAAHRIRKRYRELLLAEIAQTVDRPEDVDEEIRELFAVLGAGENKMPV